VTNGTSILADMAAGTLLTKEEKAGTTLTPVAGEAPRPQKIAASFPNDMPTEVMREAMRDIQRTIEHLQSAALALATSLGAEPEAAPIVDEAEATKIRERAADEAALARDAAKFAADFEGLKAAAQAAVYGDQVAPDGTTTGDPEPGGWQCPVHGGYEDRIATRSKREYRGCSLGIENCDEFERL